MHDLVLQAETGLTRGRQAGTMGEHTGGLLVRAYLAGPDVFLPNARRVGEAKRQFCQSHGLDAYFPLDSEIDIDAYSGIEAARRIFLDNINLLEDSDIVLANVTPFRGYSADIGTVFEIAYAIAKSKKVFAYSSEEREYSQRLGAQRNSFMMDREGSGGYIRDVNGMLVEDFGLLDNLMLAVPLQNEAGRIFVRPAVKANAQERVVAFDAFRDCVVYVSTLYRDSEQKAGAV